MPIWTDAVTNAIRRHVAKTGSPIFTRRDLIAAEKEAMVAETETTGVTPTQTMGRELQQLRDDGLLAFLDRGVYQWFEGGPSGLSKAVLVLDPASSQRDRPEHRYRFPKRWLHLASSFVGNWIVYQDRPGAGGRGYHAVARVDAIDPDPNDETMLVAVIARGTYLEFGRDVPLLVAGRVVEHGLRKPDGDLDHRRAAVPVRFISNDDFDHIVDLGVITEAEVLPRIDEFEPATDRVSEERAGWGGPIDRATMLVNRAVRDRQFRKRVLDVYGARCALTGMKLINGGGRAETQAAHIMSVEAGGPDAVNNGIALSGTVHWMFDRGLISLSDAGDILLSHAINDRASVEKLLYPDRKARLPQRQADRPRAEYLDWHRTTCFHG